ncbi:MAG TPA: FAD:protein FMN transferase [Steroidobacteraceae bacterium]|nr:FAD:protein FMN transferase [Steroidobacteraceae bacterium]
MGTAVVIEAEAASRTQAEAALVAAFAALTGIERCLHPRGAQSELARLNAAQPGTAVAVGHATLEVLRFAQHLHALSAGVFDPCLPTRAGRLADLELRGGARPCAIAHAPLEIDCGGIAKGYAVDAAVAALRRGGCSAGLVNAGGDLRVFGELTERLWLRGAGGTLTPLELREAAVAVSDRDAPQAPREHRGYYVRGGEAGTRRFAVVRARDAMSADALTKCVLLATPLQVRALLAACGAEALA